MSDTKTGGSDGSGTDGAGAAGGASSFEEASAVEDWGAGLADEAEGVSAAEEIAAGAAHPPSRQRTVSNAKNRFIPSPPL
ncbi:MAG: hypothetical protein IJM93_07705 [Oscillospiraceae bacterium]|nr:hypothetical protein [Oscillospiraceae bacterium]